MQTNAQHYPTQLGRIRGFLRFCRRHSCRSCPLFDGDRLSRLCALRWLTATFEPIHNRKRADIFQDDLFSTENDNAEDLWHGVHPGRTCEEELRHGPTDCIP